jgi:hypothetical protein
LPYHSFFSYYYELQHTYNHIAMIKKEVYAVVEHIDRDVRCSYYYASRRELVIRQLIAEGWIMYEEVLKEIYPKTVVKIQSLLDENNGKLLMKDVIADSNLLDRLSDEELEKCLEQVQIRYDIIVEIELIDKARIVKLK